MIQGKIPERTASLLYAALAADTGGFRYANTTPYTHKIAAKLIECGANHFQICRNLFEMKSKTALAAEAFAMEHVKYLCGGKISYVKITEADKARGGFEDEDTYDVINVIRRAEGECLSCRAASEVWKLLGRRGLEMPDRAAVPGESFLTGSVGYQMRSGTHFLSRTDWQKYMEFARIHINEET